MKKNRSKNGLLPRQERFAREYVKDLNGTAAYKRAGYKPRNDEVAASNAARLLGNEGVSALVARLLAKANEAAEVTVEEVLGYLRKEASGIQRDSTASSRTRAAELLGKHAGMFRDKVDHGGRIVLDFRGDLGDEEEPI